MHFTSGTDTVALRSLIPYYSGSESKVLWSSVVMELNENSEIFLTTIVRPHVDASSSRLQAMPPCLGDILPFPS